MAGLGPLGAPGTRVRRAVVGEHLTIKEAVAPSAGRAQHRVYDAAELTDLPAAPVHVRCTCGVSAATEAALLALDDSAHDTSFPMNDVPQDEWRDHASVLVYEHGTLSNPRPRTLSPVFVRVT